MYAYEIKNIKKETVYKKPGNAATLPGKNQYHMHLNHQYQIQELQMYEKSNKKSYEVNFYNTISINHRNVCIC